MRHISYCILIIVVFGFIPKDSKCVDHERIIDSLNQKADELRAKLPRLNKNKTIGYYSLLRELDVTLFSIAFEEFLQDEELEYAERMTKKAIKRAETRGDLYLVGIYRSFQKRILEERKNQVKRYGYLIGKEKNFKREIDFLIKDSSVESLQKAKRITELAMKYANENELLKAQDFLKEYDKLIDVKMLNAESPYDLHQLTRSEWNFIKMFEPLISSDSLQLIRKAGEMAEHCYVFSRNNAGKLDTNFFSLQINAYKNALSDYFERQGLINSQKNSNTIIHVDALNPYGVYRWHDYIIVIGSMNFQSKFEIVKRGEAIIDADYLLLEYIRLNKLIKIRKRFKLGKAFLLSYIIDDKREDFNYDADKNEWQYMVCYPLVENKNTTEFISQYMPSVIFKQEETGNSNHEKLSEMEIK